MIHKYIFNIEQIGLAKQMNGFYIFLTFFFIQINSQIVISFNKTAILRDLGPAESLQIWALIAIYYAHPELSNFTVASINSISGQNYSRLFYFVQLCRDGTRVKANIYTQSQQNMVESIFFVIIDNNLTDVQETSNYSLSNQSLQSQENKTFNDSSSDQTLNNKNRNLFGKLFKDVNVTSPTLLAIYNKVQNSSQNSQYSFHSQLNGYLSFDNYDDERYKIALKHLNCQYRNLMNYKISQVYYQIFSGVNFIVEYQGFDSFTTIVAKINVDLQNRPQILSFNVTCALSNLQCQNYLAIVSFEGIETLLMVRTQLLGYYLIVFKIVKIYNANSFLFMVIFQNSQIKTQILSELMIDNREMSIKTFYTYLYHQ